MRRRLAAAVLAALVLAPLAHAAAGPVFGLRAVGNPKRGYFVYPLAPSAVKRGAVIVSNTGTQAGTVRLFTTDGTTGATTGTVYQTEQRPTRAGAWIALATKQLTLRPGQHRTVPFVVRVPKSAKAGEWVGGIVAESKERVQAPSTKRKARVQIRIRDLTIVAVQVNVPGPHRVAMTIGGVKTGGQRGFQQVIAHIASNGNVLVKPAGTIAILAPNGTPVQTLRFKMDTFLPQTAIDYPVLLKHALAPGTYTAAVTLDVPATDGVKPTRIAARRPLVISKQQVQQIFTTAAPQAPPPGATASSGSSGSSVRWPLVAGVAGAVLVISLLTLLAVRRRHRGPSESRPTRELEPQPGPAPAVARLLEPEPAAVPEPEPEPADVPVPAAPSSAPASRNGDDDCDHLWDVAYHHAKLGEDGVWRFPHRCRTCGRELLAADVADANLSAAR
jgi:hypothetical protein